MWGKSAFYFPPFVSIVCVNAVLFIWLSCRFQQKMHHSILYCRYVTLDIFGQRTCISVSEGMANMANIDMGHNSTQERQWTPLALNVVWRIKMCCLICWQLGLTDLVSACWNRLECVRACVCACVGGWVGACVHASVCVCPASLRWTNRT